MGGYTGRLGGNIPIFALRQVIKNGLRRLERFSQRRSSGSHRSGLSVVPAMVVITMFVIMSVMIVEVAVSLVIRMVIVLNTAAVSLPIPRIEPFAVVAGRNPASPLVGWPRPIALMPVVVLSYRIPVTCHPHALWSRLCGYNQCHSRWWWHPNYNSN
jgi:hypothetical protein